MVPAKTLTVDILKLVMQSGSPLYPPAAPVKVSLHGLNPSDYWLFQYFLTL
jgi:hypothetical protein